MSSTKCMYSQFAYITITYYCCCVVRVSACFSGRCQVEDRYRRCIICLYASSVGNVVHDDTSQVFHISFFYLLSRRMARKGLQHAADNNHI